MAKKAKDGTAKAKGGKAKKGKGAKRPKDATARFLGSLVGLLMVAWGCWLLIEGRLDMLTAGKLALAALVSSLVVERVIVPFGRLVIGPPADPQ